MFITASFKPPIGRTGGGIHGTGGFGRGRIPAGGQATIFSESSILNPVMQISLQIDQHYVKSQLG